MCPGLLRRGSADRCVWACYTQAGFRFLSKGHLSLSVCNKSGFVPTALFALVTGAQQRKPLSLWIDFSESILGKRSLFHCNNGGYHLWWTYSVLSALPGGPHMYLLLTANCPGWHSACTRGNCGSTRLAEFPSVVQLVSRRAGAFVGSLSLRGHLVSLASHSALCPESLMCVPWPGGKQPPQ